MVSLNFDLVKRVKRLPKPARTSDALQPMFEAISNGIHAVYARWGEEAPAEGVIDILVSTNRDKKNITIEITDNGIGLNDQNFEAFTTTDTDHKISYGGKGVGRLLWLDCFEDIKLNSVYEEDGKKKRRGFMFKLRNDDQIKDYVEVGMPPHAKIGTTVTLGSIRDNGYLDKFPGRPSYIFQHIFSHFLPVFVGGRSPTFEIVCGDEARTYPKDMDSYISRRKEVKDILFNELGKFRITLLECHKSASASLGGDHFIHFIANDRTVVSQKIDGKLGLKYFGPDKDRVFHACVFSTYLDEHVNQERTGFNFDDRIIDSIVNEVCMPYVEQFLSGPLEAISDEQKLKIADIVDSYPSVSFGSVEELQSHLPTGELSPDAIYSHLARQRFRRDQKQSSSIHAAFKNLKGGQFTSEGFFASVKEAVSVLEEAETKSLAEYVIRRKAVLDFLEVLLQKVRNDTKDSSYQTENILHSLICPVRVSTVGSEKTISAASSHELWVIDERLTFAQYFSSDRPFSELGKAFDSEDRADIVIFNTVHSLKQADEASRIMLIEFKRPGRDTYPDSENPIHQVERYVKILQSGKEIDVKGRPIKLASNIVFNCFIVADIIGKIDEWTYTWERTPGTDGRRYVPRDGFNGTIELIGWDSLLLDAKSRNRAFFDRMGISGRSVFSTTDP